MAPEDFSPDDILPGTRIGAYVVRTMLGQGGSSSVYEVESAEGHRFALKICRYPGDASGTSGRRVDQRYSRSIACLQLLKGRRNVAELYAHDRYPDPLHGYQYLVQELVPDSLLITDWVKRKSPTLRKLVGAFVELAELCGVMASKGICHRDLKPANILVTPEGTPKVIDFESATCPHAEPVTCRGPSAEPGTGGWHVPELCQDILEEESKKKRKKQDKEARGFHPWGDLFSLGLVFYECLAGEHPFDNLPDGLAFEELAFETPIHQVRLRTVVPRGLNKVVMKLLEKQPEARYREGAEVVKDLRKLLKKAKDKRWDEPFKQPVPDEEDAPASPLVSALFPSEARALDAPAPEPGSVHEKESERPVPSPSEPHKVGTGASAKVETDREATSSPRSARPDASPHSAVTDVLRSDELDTAKPRRLPESDPAVGAVLDLGRAGAYTLEQCLGRGGMGEVYKARQVGAKGFSQLVAIKRLRPGWREPEERAFADEARVLSLLHHENIARVYGFFELEGNSYLVMEYIEGHSLHALLELARRKGHRFSESVACAVMAAVANALDYAHQARDNAGQILHIVHRDVSPTNILIAKTGRVVLVDFGVALSKDEGRAATPAGFTTIKGKAPYLSPEQVKHLPLDARSDLFSVGTILMELLTGAAPFGWTNDYRTLNRIETVTPEYVASLLPGVSEPLRALCQKLLAPHPDQRFATGRAVAKALRHHAGLGEGPRSIQAEVERLQTLPDAKAPPAPAAEAAARSLSEVKRARRIVALASAAMLAMLVFVSWYVPRHAVPVPSSPPLQGPAVSLLRPPEEAATTPVLPLPDNPLVCKPKGEDGAAIAAGPSDLAPGTHPAPAVSLASKKVRVPLVTMSASPAQEGRTDEAGQVSLDSDEATATLRSEIVAARGQTATMTASYVKVSGEMLSVDHALAALLVHDRVDLTPFRAFDTWWLHEDGVDVKVSILTPKNDESEADKGRVAVVLNVTNRNLALPWRLQEVRLTTAIGERPWPFAVRSGGESIFRGQSGTVAIVMDLSTFDRARDGEEVVLDVLRTGGYRQVSTGLAVRGLIDH